MALAMGRLVVGDSAGERVVLVVPAPVVRAGLSLAGCFAADVGGGIVSFARLGFEAAVPAHFSSEAGGR
jgi:hypothetical protein